MNETGPYLVPLSSRLPLRQSSASRSITNGEENLPFRLESKSKLEISESMMPCLDKFHDVTQLPCQIISSIACGPHVDHLCKSVLYLSVSAGCTYFLQLLETTVVQ